MSLCKENCVKVMLITERPIANLKAWNRLKSNGQYLTNIDSVSYDITAKEEIQFVYEVYYNSFYHMFTVDKAYPPSKVADYIEVFYSDLPDKRDVKFIVTTTPMETHYVYYTDNESIVGVYDKLVEIINSKVNVQDKYIYSVDLANNLYRVNEECEDVKELIMEAIYEE